MNGFFLTLVLLGTLSGGPVLPYWAQTGQYGRMPYASGGMALVQAKTQFDPSRDFQWCWGVGLAANTSSSLFADECFLSGRWKALTLDAGLKHREMDYMGASYVLGSLSVTGGHLIESGNTRAMPGYRLTLDPVDIPFTRGHLALYGSWGDFKTLDNRWVEGTLVHRMELFLLARLGERLELHAGLDHYALWGGDAMAFSLDNYFRVATGRHASASGSISDQINVIGDHGGAECFKVKWSEDAWSLTFQHDIPYSDKSGIRFNNFPDGVNTLHFGWVRKDRWVSDILYEFHYTRNQSGPLHEAEVDAEGNVIPWHPGMHIAGGDDYFNNGEYRSGWTYFGRPIGLPLFFPTGTKDGVWNPSEMVLGVENNRIRAHHLGVSGQLFRRMPYKLLLTYSQNYGTFSKPYAGESAWGKPWGTVKETPLRQFSAAFVGEVPTLFGIEWMHLSYGVYADYGQVLPTQMGATLGLRCRWGH